MILQAQNVSKRFPGTLALNNVSLSFESGKVNALVGKNGSGKSTLIKAINGSQLPTSGEILLDGNPLQLDTPSAAFDQGIMTVYQELSLVPGLTVAENILIGRYSMKHGFINWKEIYAQAQEVLSSMEINISPKELVQDLSVWQCQMVEIAKAMHGKPKVLLLDEPTSALAQHETEMLFKLVRELKRKDVIIIYITHRLQELWDIADNCSVLRDGEYVGKLEMKDASHKDLLDLMFGDVEIQDRPADLIVQEETAMSVRGLTSEPDFRNVSFELKRGEVLGIAGMLGSGRTELLKAIFGTGSLDSGEIEIDGKVYKRPNPTNMKNAGLGLTPEDRKNEGLVQIHSVGLNLTNASLKKISNGAFINAKAYLDSCTRQVDNLQIKIAGLDVEVSSLSGGNQQKVVVGNWLNTAPRIMLFDEPSRGIDVNAKQQIFEIIWQLSRDGISSVVVSSELEELLEICHRILIMRSGEIVDEADPANLGIDQLYSICMGVNQQHV